MLSTRTQTVLRGVLYSNLTLKTTQKKRKVISDLMLKIYQNVQGAWKSEPIGNCFWTMSVQVLYILSLSLFPEHR